MLVYRCGESRLEIPERELLDVDMPMVYIQTKVHNWLDEIHRYEALPRQASRIR